MWRNPIIDSLLQLVLGLHFQNILTKFVCILQNLSKQENSLREPSNRLVYLVLRRPIKIGLRIYNPERHLFL